MKNGTTLDVLILVLAALSTYRLSVLIATDLIMEPVREFWQRRWPTSDFVYPENKVDAADLTQLTGHARAWPFKREVIFTDGEWGSVNEYRMGYLIECFYCVSVWVAFGITVATYESMNLGYDWQFVLNFLGIAAGAEIINNVFSRE